MLNTNKFLLKLFNKLLIFYYYNNLPQIYLKSQFIKFLLETYFFKNFYKIYKSFIIKNTGLLTINFTKSLTYSIINSLNNLQITFSKIIQVNSIYLQPIIVVNFSFHKKTYNTLIIFILFFLTTFYSNNYTNFNLYYSFIIIPKNFLYLNFLNNYYFKLYQY